MHNAFDHVQPFRCGASVSGCASEHCAYACGLVHAMRKWCTSAANRVSQLVWPRLVWFLVAAAVHPIWLIWLLIWSCCGAKIIVDIPRKPLVSCDCSSFHSESELKLLDRCLRHLSHEYLVCTPLQGYAVATSGCSLKSRRRMNASSMQRKARIRAGGVFDTRSPNSGYPRMLPNWINCQWNFPQWSL